MAVVVIGIGNPFGRVVVMSSGDSEKIVTFSCDNLQNWSSTYHQPSLLVR